MKRALLATLLIAASPVGTAQQALPGGSYESAHFEISADASHLPMNIGPHFDEIYAVVTERLGVSLEERVRLSFDAPNAGPCPSRGWTMYPPPGVESDQPHAQPGSAASESRSTTGRLWKAVLRCATLLSTLHPQLSTFAQACGEIRTPFDLWNFGAMVVLPATHFFVFASRSHPDIRRGISAGEAHFVRPRGAVRLLAEVDVEGLVLTDAADLA